MNFDPNNSFLVMVVLVFVAVLLLLESLYMMWKSHHGPEAKKLNKRLQALSAVRDGTTQTRLLRQRMLSELPAMERLLARIPRLRALDSMLLQAGLDWTVGKLLLLCGVFALLGWFIASSLITDPWLPVALVLAFAVMPFLYVAYRRNARINLIQRQLPDALDLITRALRAGHAFTSALKMAGEELAEPIAGEFRTVHDEVNFGVSLQQALGHLSDRTPLTDLRYFVVAVLIQRESGGNLTEILGNLSRLIRERLKLFAKVKVLSSEGRLSAWVLGLMPFALAGLMNVFNPEFMTPLWRDPIGIAIVQYMLFLMAIGVVILIKIVKIRV
jgi:tight adherence protein B